MSCALLLSVWLGFSVGLCCAVEWSQYGLLPVNESSGYINADSHLQSARGEHFEHGAGHSLHVNRLYGKTVWILWWQGWSEAPWLAREVVLSWRRHNPTWNVELISGATLHNYLHIPYLHSPRITTAMKSDIIRINLLAKYGGVWADASLLCFAPLDTWVYDALRPSGYFMYYRLCIWFMVSVRQSYIIQRLKQVTDDHWLALEAEGKVSPVYSFLDDVMGHGLLRTDKRFIEAMENIPYMDCCNSRNTHDGPFVRVSPNMVDTCSGCDSTPEALQLWENNPPYVLKLSIHGGVDPPSNAWNAVRLSKIERKVPVSHTFTFKDEKALPFYGYEVYRPSSCRTRALNQEHRGTVGPAVAGQTHEEVLRRNWTNLLVLDRCGFCGRYPVHVTCRPEIDQQFGRDSLSFLD